MVKKIIQLDDPRLRKTSAPIKEITLEVKFLIKDMKETLLATESAMALAAPQIGENKRIFVIKKLVDEENNLEIPELTAINPEIIQESEQKSELNEGCLSVAQPEITGQVKRSNTLTLKYLSPENQEKELKAEGLLARIIQHEIDHLDGKVFIDRADPTTLQQVEKDD